MATQHGYSLRLLSSQLNWQLTMAINYARSVQLTAVTIQTLHNLVTSYSTDSLYHFAIHNSIYHQLARDAKYSGLVVQEIFSDIFGFVICSCQLLVVAKRYVWRVNLFLRLHLNMATHRGYSGWLNSMAT